MQFSELADIAIDYIQAEYSRPADDVARVNVAKEWFKDRSADSITPAEIREKLKEAADRKKWSASTANHHYNVISLCFRLGMEREKVKESPIHMKVRKQKENNNRVRFLSADEEKRLHEAIRSKPEWAEHEPERAEHEPELDLALHTGLRRRSMYIHLLWENVDLEARVAIMPRTKNDDQVVVPLNDVAMRAFAVFRARGEGRGRVERNAAGKTLTVNAHWFIPRRAQRGNHQLLLARLPRHLRQSSPADGNSARKHRGIIGTQWSSNDETLRAPEYQQSTRSRFPNFE